jgi:hypothetical protein
VIARDRKSKAYRGLTRINADEKKTKSHHGGAAETRRTAKVGKQNLIAHQHGYARIGEPKSHHGGTEGCKSPEPPSSRVIGNQKLTAEARRRGERRGSKIEKATGEGGLIPSYVTRMSINRKGEEQRRGRLWRRNIAIGETNRSCRHT